MVVKEAVGMRSQVPDNTVEGTTNANDAPVFYSVVRSGTDEGYTMAVRGVMAGNQGWGREGQGRWVVGLVGHGGEFAGGHKVILGGWLRVETYLLTYWTKSSSFRSDPGRSSTMN
jgi:hypothetical protein